MNDTEIIIEVAKLDGWACNNSSWFSPSGGVNACHKQDGGIIPDEDILPPYLTSRDAIIPVIEKQTEAMRAYVIGALLPLLPKPQDRIRRGTAYFYARIMCATPRHLCIALLKATGKYSAPTPAERSHEKS